MGWRFLYGENSFKDWKKCSDSELPDWETSDTRTRKLLQIRYLRENGLSMVESLSLADGKTPISNLLGNPDPIRDEYKINDDFGFKS